MAGQGSTVLPDEIIPLNDEANASSKKKTKSGRDEGMGKVSSHKKKSHEKVTVTGSGDLDSRGSVHKKKSKEVKIDDINKSEHRKAKKSIELDKSAHKKKLKDNDNLDKASTHKKKSKEKDDLDKSSKHKSKKSRESKKTESIEKGSTHRKKSKETKSIDNDSQEIMHKLQKSDNMDKKSSHKKSKSAKTLDSSSTHSKTRKRSSSHGKKVKISSDDDNVQNTAGSSSTSRRGKKSEILSQEKTSSDEDVVRTKSTIGTRRGKRKELLQEMGMVEDDSSSSDAGSEDSDDAIPLNDKTSTMKDEQDPNKKSNNMATCPKQRQLHSMDEGGDTSDDDSSMASFAEEGDNDNVPFKHIDNSVVPEKRQGTRGPSGLFLTRQNSRDIGRILVRQASEEDIFAALEAEADEIKHESENASTVRSTASSYKRSSSFDRKSRAPPARSQSMAAPKWQPGQQIKPMAAEELRDMLKLKGPPKRSQTWRDSPWFRDDIVPTMPLTLAAFPTPTNDSGKLITRANGTMKMLRPDECVEMKKHSAIRKSEVKDALAQYLNATIH